MFEDLKILLGLLIMAILSALIRFTTFVMFCMDAILGFLMGYGFYYAFAYFIEDGGVRSGIACLITLVSRPLYDAGNKIIKNKLDKWIDRRIK